MEFRFSLSDGFLINVEVLFRGDNAWVFPFNVKNSFHHVDIVKVLFTQIMQIDTCEIAYLYLLNLSLKLL